MLGWPFGLCHCSVWLPDVVKLGPDAPWWHRYDTTVFDNYADDEAGLEEWNTKIKTDVFDSATVHVLNDIDDAIKNALNKQEPTEIIDLEEFKAEINKRKKWKPTLV